VKLLSAVVRNYRVHREVSVEFDGSRTLIGGPNESGKSTLMEAVHRALFLKATVTGDAQAGMTSTVGAGQPEVELRFEAHGDDYQLTKRFSGPSGTARLTQVGGPTWQGEEAETRLAGLLGVEAAGGGKGVLGRVEKQWAHLWVWQGRSSGDVCEHLEGNRTGLLRQLQEVGGSVALQSELDGRVASWFAQTRNLVFTLARVPKAGSDLERAQTESRQAEVARAAAGERLDSLRQAIKGYELASSAIIQAEGDLEKIKTQRLTVGERLVEVETLCRLEERRAEAVAGETQKVTDLQQTEESVSGLRRSIKDLRESLEPREQGLAGLEAGLAATRRQKVEAEDAYDRALESGRAARLRLELAGACVTRFEKAARCLDLESHLERIEGYQKGLEYVERQIAQLAPVDQAGLDRLQALENRQSRALAALEAMSTEVEVVASDRPVLVGDVRLSPGGTHTVSDLTEVTVGDQVRLRIRPGGGAGLEQARAAVRASREELRRSLDAYGLESIQRATEVALQRADLEAARESQRTKLGEWDPEQLVLLLKQSRDELTAAQADVRRRLDQVEGLEEPSTLEEARGWVAAELSASSALESQAATAKTALDTLRDRVLWSEEEHGGSRAAIEAERQKLKELQWQLDYLVRAHGTDEARAKALQAANDTKAKLETELEETRRGLAALQPELLEADRTRLQRAWEEADQQLRDAQTARAVHQAALRSDGADDPQAVFAQAEARAESAAKRLDVVGRKAAAIALVDDLFHQEQRALSDQFSQPLAGKIDAYLQCLFGSEARTAVVFEDDAFKGIRLVRSGQGGTCDFETLSVGAREQVAAAVRLAIAELLAAGHDGSLPVVFDDAFAYSDPERVAALQRMLELGASRGLQMIVLTCNPSDYAAFGARQTILTPAG
jgi:DNA repair exonuclease SbcCD ATPase subunit